MKSYTVQLKDIYPNLQGGTLDCILMDPPFDHLAPDWRRPAVVVVPGGGYGMVSKREGEPIASHFLAKGFQVFILTYLIRGDGVCYPEQLFELSCAMDYVKTHAAEMRVNPDEVFAVGFSAGGHLVGNLAVEFSKAGETWNTPIDAKPKAVGLAYPVIRYDAGHKDSHNNLLWGYSDEEKEALLPSLNLDTRVTNDTPPAFIWSTTEDACVPPKNALMYALAMSEHHIPYELHVYPQGGHGSSACSFEVNGPQFDFLKKNRKWLDDCSDFFRMFSKIPY